jgi:hypothetical protein
MRIFVIFQEHKAAQLFRLQWRALSAGQHDCRVIERDRGCIPAPTLVQLSA